MIEFLPAAAGKPGFSPLSTGVIVAWLRNSTIGADAISSVPDTLNSNPAVQTQAARRPTGNADHSMTFATNDVLSVPLIGSETDPGVINNGTSQWGIAFWVEHAAGGSEEAYACIGNLTGGASAMKLDFKKITTNFLRVDMYNDPTNARRITATSNALVAGTPAFITLEYNADNATENDRLVMTVNTTVVTQSAANLVGTGDISLGLAAGVTGNLLLGNRRDSTAASPLNGTFGKNIWFIGSAMTGVTTGLLTPAARTALMGLEPLV